MKTGQLSKKEYKQQCNTKKMKCKQNEICHIHEGRANLKKLKSLLRNVQPNHPSWKIGINWSIMTGGFLETLINFRHIREDFIKTKKEVDKFNESRTKLKTYKKEINQLLDLKQSSKPYQDTIQKQRKKYGISSRNPKKKQHIPGKQPTKTILRLRQKLWKIEQNKDPYTDEEENEIFLQMFRNNEIRKYCEQSTIYYDNILLTHAKVSDTLDSFRRMYNGLYRWSDAKLLNRLREKWKILETI